MPFQPGNKHGRGRPKAGKSLSDALKVALRERLTDGRTHYRAIADVLVRRALDGDMRAIREIFDRTEGKIDVSRTIDQTGPRPIVLNLQPQDLGLL